MSAGKYRKEQDCLNCGSHVEKHYCSSCGQPNLELKENFWQFISHSIAHYFHFDNKFFQTLKPLITQPGQVTLDYLAGKRARYINPVSMYIFVSIIYFLIVPKASIKSDIEENDKVELKRKIEKTRVITDTLSKEFDDVKIGVLKDVLTSLNDKAIINDFKELSFKDQEKMIQKLKASKDTSNAEIVDERLEDFTKYHIIKQDSTYASYQARQKLLPESDRDNWFERLLKKREITINQKTLSGWTLKQEMEHYMPKQYFLLMPLLALFIMWNFRRNHIYYLDHLIFTIHGMTAYFIVEIFSRPLLKYVFGYDSTIGNILGFAVFVWITWYLYTALKIFYNRSRKTTIWRMIWLLMLYGIALFITEKIISQTIYYFLA